MPPAASVKTAVDTSRRFPAMDSRTTGRFDHRQNSEYCLRQLSEYHTSFCLMILLYTTKLGRNGFPPSPGSFFSSNIRYTKGPSSHTLPELTAISAIDQCYLTLSGRRASSVSSKVDSLISSSSKNPAE